MGEDLFQNDEVGVVYSVQGISPAELAKLDETISENAMTRKDRALVANDKEASFSELKLTNTIVHSLPEELLLADELSSIAKAESKNKESAAVAFHLMLVHALQPKILAKVQTIMLFVEELSTLEPEKSKCEPPKRR